MEEFTPLSFLKGKKVKSLLLLNNVEMDISISDIAGIGSLLIDGDKEVYIDFQNLDCLYSFTFHGSGSFNVENIYLCKDTLEFLEIINCIEESEKVHVEDVLQFPNIRSIETDVMDLFIKEIKRYPKNFPFVPSITEGKEYKLFVNNPLLFNNEKINELLSSRISKSIKDNQNDSCGNREFYEKWNISNGDYQEVIDLKVNYTKNKNNNEKRCSNYRSNFKRNI